MAAPTLALAGVALVPLRLLPVLARGADLLAARSRRLTGALASWQLSRRPIRQSGPVLLVILAAAAGTLALTQHATWRQSAEDQAQFTVGSDIRVSLAAPVPLGRAAILPHAPGTGGAMPVATFNGGIGPALALDARQAADVVLIRPDQSALPGAALWRKITPRTAGPGLTLPGRPARLELTASLRPTTSGPALAPMSATFSVQDADGIVYAVPAGRLAADARPHQLTALLTATRQASYPLRLLAVTLSYQLPPIPAPAQFASKAVKAQDRVAARRAAARHTTLTLDGLAVSPSAAGAFPVFFAAAAQLASWQPDGQSADLDNPLARGFKPVVTGWLPASGGRRLITFRPGDGYLKQRSDQPPLPITGELTLTAGRPSPPIPAIASRSFLSSASLAVGSTTFVAAGPVNVPVRIVAEVRDFPTAGPGGILIVDQTAIQQALAAMSAAPLPVNQWWLRSAPGPGAVTGAAGHVLTGVPPGSSVVYRAQVLAALLGNSLSAAPQQAVLAIAIAAALLAVLGFSVSVAASVRERRTQSAVLSALGVSKAAQARQLCLEELLLSGPAAVIGLVLGAGLAHLLVPAVTLTASAAIPVPPPLIELPLAWAAGLVVTITAIPVLVAAASVARRSDPAARLRAAEAL